MVLGEGGGGGDIATSPGFIHMIDRGRRRWRSEIPAVTAAISSDGSSFASWTTALKNISVKLWLHTRKLA